jgi:hypothetical protein
VLAQVEGVGQAGRGGLEFKAARRKKRPAEAGLKFCEHVQRGPPLQTDNFTRGRSFQTAKRPRRGANPVHGA